jgi:ketosteroid isomerase-like protein
MICAMGQGESSVGVGQDEVDLVKAAYERWNEGDVVALAELMAPDVVYQNSPEWPGQRVYRGSENVLRFLEEEVRETIQLTPVEIIRTEVFGHEILLELRARAAGKVSGLDLNDVRLFHVSRLRDGKVVRTRVYLDEQQALSAASTGRD